MIFLWIYSFYRYWEGKKTVHKIFKVSGGRSSPNLYSRQTFTLGKPLGKVSQETSCEASWMCTHFGGGERGRGGTAQERSPGSSQHLLWSHSAPQPLAEHPQPPNRIASFQKLLLRQTLGQCFRTIHFSHPDISFSKDYCCSKLES